MRLQDVLRRIRGLTRNQVMREVKEGFIRPQVEQKGKKTFYHYTPTDVVKLSKLAELRRRGLGHKEARQKVEKELAELARTEGTGIRLVAYQDDNTPISSRRIESQKSGIVFETDAEGNVSRISVGPDFSMDVGVLRETKDALDELFEFYRDAVVSGLVTDKQVDAIKLLVDSYAESSAQESKREILENVFGGLVKGITEVLSGTPECVAVPESVCKALEEIPRPSLERLEVAPELTPDVMPFDRDLGPLFLSGVYGSEGGRFTLGSSRPEGRKDLPGVNIIIPLGNLENLLDPTHYRRLFFERILKDYCIEAWPDYADMIRPLPLDESREHVRRLIRAMAAAEQRFGEAFTFVPDDASFYNQGRRMYEGSLTVFIFAATSGILIPDEYTGKGKCPFRPRYFEEGLLKDAKGGPARYYQWDRRRSSARLWECYSGRGSEHEKNGFKQGAEEIVKRALAIPGLEMTESDFSSAEWKRHFTLVSEDRSILSVRTEDRRIGHGLIVGKGFSENVRVCDALARAMPRGSGRPSSLLDFVQAKYRSEDKLVLKGLNETYVGKEAAERAREIVEEHLTLGKKLALSSEKRPRHIK